MLKQDFEKQFKNYILYFDAKAEELHMLRLF
jgi:hypothetical protein